MQVELEAVGDGVVVNASDKTAGAGELVAVEASASSEFLQFGGGAAGVVSATAA